MKQLAVISGKGGTGKTVLLASFAALASSAVVVDCDVDAANLYLLLHPKIKETHQFWGGKKALLSEEDCTHCMDCVQVCRFGAIREFENGQIEIDPFSCEGCGVCAFICPTQAITMKPNLSGEWFVSESDYGAFVHAKLGVGEENSGKLVAEIRKKAQDVADEKEAGTILVDGPPGIGCPVIASVTGVDMALVVTEPSLAGIHDMERVIQTARHFGVKTACCINKYDINTENSEHLIRWCKKNSIPLVGKIPYDEEITQAMLQGQPVVKYTTSHISKKFIDIWQQTQRILNE